MVKQISNRFENSTIRIHDVTNVSDTREVNSVRVTKQASSISQTKIKTEEIPLDDTLTAQFAENPSQPTCNVSSFIYQSSSSVTVLETEALFVIIFNTFTARILKRLT